jgi:Protein of unknown function (DUF2778)
MTDATTALCDVTSFESRVFPLGDYRWVIRGVVVCAGSVAAACALVITVTVAATWIISAALFTSSNTHAMAPIGSRTFALAKYDLTLVGTADVSSPARVSTGPSDATDVTIEAKWARATASALLSTVPLRPLESANNVPSSPPHPLEAPPNEAKPEIANGRELTRVAVAPASPTPGTLPLPPEPIPDLANSVPLPRPHPAKPEIARSLVGQAAPPIAADTSPPAPFYEKSVTLQEAPNKSMSLPGPDSRTAVYDIAAHTVYLPNGERLEAHSGLGNKMDDPRYVNVKNRGPTPPNVYDLTLRELRFHGVRAIRLNPVDDDNMFGRDGMLAHSYMRGPNGQSSGCVSLKNYPRFLRAVLGGEVDRLVVVPNLGTSPLPIARVRRVHVSQYASNNR